MPPALLFCPLACPSACLAVTSGAEFHLQKNAVPETAPKRPPRFFAESAQWAQSPFPDIVPVFAAASPAQKPKDRKCRFASTTLHTARSIAFPCLSGVLSGKGTLPQLPQLAPPPALPPGNFPPPKTPHIPLAHTPACGTLPCPFSACKALFICRSFSSGSRMCSAR